MAAVLDLVKSYCCSCWASSAPDSAPLVTFGDTKGVHVNVSRFFVSGNGVALCNCPLFQTRSYWEMKIIEKGAFCIGVGRAGGHQLDGHLTDRKYSWAMYSGDGGGDFKVGDVVGAAYDMSAVKPVLRFYLNGTHLKKKDIRGIRGDVIAAVSVSKGCMLQANFGHTDFEFPPPEKFTGIIMSRDLL